MVKFVQVAKGVRLSAVLSVALAVWMTMVSVARAHEVTPSIGDMTQSDGTLSFAIAGNIESFVAGIDLEGLEDTNDAENAELYDELRALPPEEMAERFRAAWDQIAADITVRVPGGEPLPLELTDVIVPEVGDTELARSSSFTFTAALPDGAREAEVGWAPRLGALVLRQQGVGDPYDGYLEGGAMSPPIALAGGSAVTGMAALLNYIPVGIDHIVPLGHDHILFVLGLFLLSPRIGTLLWQVSAFTVAHTITLALAALDIVNVPASVVEPIIAASIVYVAVENIYREGSLSLWRPFVVFGFGLLHGLGFASVLADYGLPDSGFVPALIGFNVGVEIGQLAVIAVAFMITRVAVSGEEEGRTNLLGSAIYLLLALAVIPVAAVILPNVGSTGDLVPLFAAVAILLGLCAASTATDTEMPYEAVVARPASILIALIGTWWVVERTLL
ncbi:HupE/UreJ family protein [Pelagovum pacificum]|uniref:HupE/UreJ family protein n=1 Tax=Pelagovum pacificum TaxID=2588711 RepID=A0A5C5GDP2_9RHOB|nr:HupE/UreJ family protein [Pelagovum pacificum]QQA44773.1 HupE/UreJ family protein [Pelagovum pacificum]TNY32119.1 HupE/UreJ family protein [Pelagovum pacificum]